MKTQYYTSTSLDGYIATEDDSLDWLFPLGNINETSFPTFFEGVGALAMGSTTYEWMLRHSDKVAEEMGSAWPYTLIGEMNYGVTYKLAYIRGPEGIIVGLAEQQP